MFKYTKIKSRIKIIVLLAFTVLLFVGIYFLYSRMENVSKTNLLDVYKPSLEMQYASFDNDIITHEKLCRKLNDDENFNKIVEYELYNSNLALSQSAWSVYAEFSNASKSYQKITESYILFNSSKAAITQNDVLSAYGSGPDLAIDGNNYAYLKNKIFSSSGNSVLIYSDSVFHKGKTSRALIYARVIDGVHFSVSAAALVSIIPLSKVSESICMNDTFGKNIKFMIYSKTGGMVYPKSMPANINDYTVIDCDANENFSWGVYIKNSFFSQNMVYYYEIIALFISYILLCAVILISFGNNSDRYKVMNVSFRYKTLSSALRGFKIYGHINRLLCIGSNTGDTQWFRDTLPDFPKPCIMAIIKMSGANSVVIRDTFLSLGKSPVYILPDQETNFVAFFDYHPDCGGIDEIRDLCLEFINNLKKSDIDCVISISTPCMDIDEIHQSYITANLIFKYNEYDDLIIMGESGSNEGYIASDEENSRILKYILSENAFEANKIIYGQWYEISQNPSFGDEIEKLFVNQVSILASAAVKTEYDKELPSYDSKLSITDLAFKVTDAVEDMVSYITENQSNTALYNDVVGYIEENFTNPEFSQADVKEKFNISTKIISKILKQKKNMLFSEYLEKLRIEKACYILSHSDIKIYDISKMCGYGTNDAFYKAFNKKLGKTPGAYRKNNTV